MNLKQQILIIVSLFLTLTIQSQELIVKEMKATNDLSASQYRQTDLNGKPCALVKVQLATTGATFEGNVIHPTEYKSGEYWVYMTQGSRELHVKHPNFLPIEIIFANHGIEHGLQPLTTYRLTLVMPQVIGMEVDDGMRYLVMTVSPSNAIVYIDGKLQQVANGIVSNRLSVGTHKYRVEAVGYATQEGTVQLTNGKKSLPITLSSVHANLKVDCPTAGAQIYINDNLCGTAPWQGQLTAGNYMVEARLQSYRNQRQSVKLSEKENRTMKLPALIPITSSIDVNYKPLETEVWIDGKQQGTSPDIFRGILIGRHELELKKSGYETKKEIVDVAEGKTTSVVGSLSPARQLNSSVSAVGDSTSDLSIEYLITHPMCFLEENDIYLPLTQVLKKLNSKCDSRWRVEKYKKQTLYLRTAGEVYTSDGRKIDDLHCYWSAPSSGMLYYEIGISDRKFSSFDEALQYVEGLISRIKRLGYNISKDNSYSDDYHYQGDNGRHKIEIRLPKNYYNLLYIEFSFNRLK